MRDDRGLVDTISRAIIRTHLQTDALKCSSRGRLVRHLLRMTLDAKQLQPFIIICDQSQHKSMTFAAETHEWKRAQIQMQFQFVFTFFRPQSR